MEDVMRNAAHVFMGVLLAAVAHGSIGCGDDEDDGGENPFDNPGGGSSGFMASGGASGGGAANGGSGTGGGLSEGCADGIVRTSRVTPRVILLLDGSCSMSTEYPSNGGMSATECRNNGNSRWAALRNALLDPNEGVVTRLHGAVEFGLVVYGTQPSCPLTHDPILPVVDNLRAIEGALGDRPPGMFTPTGAAMDHVYRNLIEPMSPDQNMGKQIVVLATDGEPNSCDDAQTNYEPSLQAAELGRSMMITTYVISLANAEGEFHNHLQELANLGAGFDAQGGQMAKLYEPSTPEQLAADLELLIGGAVGCDIALNGDVDPNRVCEGEVTLNDQVLGCNDPNGWSLIDSRHIRLEGSACEQLKSDATAVVRADFDCNIFNPQ
jgi:hypothetical protein